MDGKGRASDNAFIERLWRSAKYDKLYLEPPSDGHDLCAKVENYFFYYHHARRYSSLDDQYPAELYKHQLKVAA